MEVRIHEVSASLDVSAIDFIMFTGIIPRFGETIQLKVKNQSMYEDNLIFLVSKISHIVNITNHVGVTVEVVRQN